jgi:hypothetical protein
MVTTKGFGDVSENSLLRVYRAVRSQVSTVSTKSVGRITTAGGLST